MKTSSQSGTAAQSTEVLTSVFENVIEFNSDGTLRCLKISPQLTFLPQMSLRIMTEDFIRYVDGRFIFEDSRFSFSALQAQRGAIPFTVVQDGEVIEYIGFVIPLGSSFGFCFNRVNGDEKSSAVPEEEAESRSHSVFIKTFGYFEVCKDGRPVFFRCEKAKELLALLVDRQGGYLSSKEGAALLWPKEETTDTVLTRYRKTCLRLSEILRENGMEHIIDVSTRKRRLIPESVDCDLFDFLGHRGSGKFPGVYMKNYVWGQDTKKYLETV